MVKVRIKFDCTVFVNTIRYEFKRGETYDVNEVQLKKLRSMGAIDKVIKEDVGNQTNVGHAGKRGSAVLQSA